MTNVIIGIIVGFLVATLLYFAWFWEKFSDYGGGILIDDEARVNRFFLNDDMEDWGDQKFIIFKVSKSEKRLKRLEDIDPLELEDRNEIQ